MAGKFFKGTSAFFLPLGKRGKLTTGFTRHGGTQHHFVSEETNYIVAENWEQVIEHFLPYPGLLNHFYSLHVGVVSYEWLSSSLEKGWATWGWEYNLKPRPQLGEPGSVSRIRKLSATGSDSPTSSELGFIMSPRREALVVKKYEKDILAELELKGQESKLKKRQKRN